MFFDGRLQIFHVASGNKAQGPEVAPAEGIRIGGVAFGGKARGVDAVVKDD